MTASTTGTRNRLLGNHEGVVLIASAENKRHFATLTFDGVIVHYVKSKRSRSRGVDCFYGLRLKRSERC